MESHRASREISADIRSQIDNCSTCRCLVSSGEFTAICHTDIARRPCGALPCRAGSFFWLRSSFLLAVQRGTNLASTVGDLLGIGIVLGNRHLYYSIHYRHRTAWTSWSDNSPDRGRRPGGLWQHGRRICQRERMAEWISVMVLDWTSRLGVSRSRKALADPPGIGTVSLGSHSGPRPEIDSAKT